MPEKKEKNLIDELLEIDNHSGVDLSKKKLAALDLSDKDFSKSSLVGTSFLMSNLAGCNFSSANITDADFTDANLTKCIWDGAIRNGKQVMKYACIVNGDYSVYGFLVKSKSKTAVLINEANKPEYEYKQGTATHETQLLYNLLVNG